MSENHNPSNDPFQKQFFGTPRNTSEPAAQGAGEIKPVPESFLRGMTENPILDQTTPTVAELFERDLAILARTEEAPSRAQKQLETELAKKFKAFIKSSDLARENGEALWQHVELPKNPDKLSTIGKLYVATRTVLRSLQYDEVTSELKAFDKTLAKGTHVAKVGKEGFPGENESVKFTVTKESRGFEHEWVHKSSDLQHAASGLHLESKVLESNLKASLRHIAEQTFKGPTRNNFLA